MYGRDSLAGTVGWVGTVRTARDIQRSESINPQSTWPKTDHILAGDVTSWNPETGMEPRGRMLPEPLTFAVARSRFGIGGHFGVQ